MRSRHSGTGGIAVFISWKSALGAICLDIPISAAETASFSLRISRNSNLSRFPALTLLVDQSLNSQAEHYSSSFR